MRASLTIAAILAFAIGSAVSAEPKRIDDPDKFTAGIMALVAKGGYADISKTIADIEDQPKSVEPLQKAFEKLEGKRTDYSDKVLDKKFGKALRQIIYYTYVERTGFVYYRFNFKLTSHGWLLSNFGFKDEAEHLFPKDFVDQ